MGQNPHIPRLPSFGAFRLCNPHSKCQPAGLVSVRKRVSEATPPSGGDARGLCALGRGALVTWRSGGNAFLPCLGAALRGVRRQCVRVHTHAGRTPARYSSNRGAHVTKFRSPNGRHGQTYKSAPQGGAPDTWPDTWPDKPCLKQKPNFDEPIRHVGFILEMVPPV